MINEIVIGTASGVVSACFLILLGNIFRHIVMPWYRAITYSGIDISGEWHCIDPTMAQEITFELQQSANAISGVATFTWQEDDTDKTPRDIEVVRAFKISGAIQDRFVQLTLRHENTRRIGINSYLLEVVGDGRKMMGVFSFYSVGQNRIDESRHTLFRDRGIAEHVAAPEKGRLREHRLKLLRELQDIEYQEEAVEEEIASHESPDLGTSFAKSHPSKGLD